MEEENYKIKAIVLLNWRIINRGLPEPFAWCRRVLVTQCGASLQHGSFYIIIPHRKVTYPPTNGSLSLMQIFFYCFPLCVYFSVTCCPFRTIPWFSCCHFPWQEAFQQRTVNPDGLLYTKKKQQQNLKFDRLNIKPEIISPDVKTI